MLKSSISLLVSCSFVAAQIPDKMPTRKPLDRTGIAWTLPFTAAQARAKAEQRLIFVPVIAGGTDATGCW